MEISEKYTVSKAATFSLQKKKERNTYTGFSQYPINTPAAEISAANPHRIRTPIIPARRKRQRRAQIAIDIKRHRRALDREIGCRFGESLHDDPDDGGDDDECFFVVLAERCDGGGGGRV